MTNNEIIRNAIADYVALKGPIANEWIVRSFARCFNVSTHQIAGNLSWIAKSGMCVVRDGGTYPV